MKYFAILEDRNGFTKEIQIEGLVPYIYVPIVNPGTNRVFLSTFDYVQNYVAPSIQRKTFLRVNDDVLVSGENCWIFYREE